MPKIRAFALVGCTGSGKSALAMELARRYPSQTEIVAMDSMQIYRRMDIGTAKPTREERLAVPHHMIDIAEPDESFTAAQYHEKVLPVLREIESRGHIPLLVGGTGLYLKTLTDGMTLGGTGENTALREELFALAEQEGGREKLHERLRLLDPESAGRLHPNDIRRVVRAIEICESTGKPVAASRQPSGAGEADILPLAIRMERSRLYERLEKRIDSMLRSGLVQEVASLVESGVRRDAQSMQGIGYKELYPVVMGQEKLEDARRQMILATRHYAKRQETWFRGDARTVWLEEGEGLADRAQQQLELWLAQQPDKENKQE